MDWTQFLRRLIDPVATPVLLAAGALANRVWRRYLNRLATFRWSASHNILAVGGTDPRFGTIDVLWNGNPVNNLQFCHIEFENESSHDFSNVEVKFWYEDGTRFYGQGALAGTEQYFPWTPRFQDLVARLNNPTGEPDPGDVDYALKHREYVVPVLNRGCKFTLSFLVHPESMTPPVLRAAVLVYRLRGRLSV